MPSQGEGSAMRLVAWNVCGGGGKRVARITDALAHLAPTVVILSEVKPKKLSEWLAAMTRLGLPHHSHCIGASTSADPYGVVVASASEQRPHPWPDPPPYPNRAIRVNIGGVSVTGVHAPDGIGTARVFYDWLVPAASSALEAPSLMAGDFNADLSGDNMPLNPFFVPLTDAGWVHATRRIAPTGDHASWWGRVNAFSLDHCLTSPVLGGRILRAEVLAEIDGVRTAGRGLRVRDGALSDHRPLLVEIGTPTSSTATESA